MPKTGTTESQFWAPGGCVFEAPDFQVHTFWTWANYLKSQAPTGRNTVFINMDETSLPFGLASLKGNKFVRRPKKVGAGPGHDRLPSSHKRGALSLIAFVSSEPSLQKHLPQILLGNKHQLAQKLRRRIAHKDFGKLLIWSAPSAWVSHPIMSRILETLSASLRDFSAGRHFVLVLDCARCHISADLVNKATRLHLWMLFIPAKLTWLLQPLDVQVFRSFKSKFRAEYFHARCLKLGGVISMLEWLDMVAKVVRIVLSESTWASAFDKTGIANDQQGVSDWIREHANLKVAWVPARLPTHAEISSLGGQRIKMPWLQLVRGPILRMTGSLALLQPTACVTTLLALCDLQRPAVATSSQTIHSTAPSPHTDPQTNAERHQQCPVSAATLRLMPRAKRLGLSQERIRLASQTVPPPMPASSSH